MPPTRPLRRHLQFTSSRWGSRAQLGHLPRIQCRLFRVSEGKRRGPPHPQEAAIIAFLRERKLNECSLARQEKPLLSKIWWTVKCIPRLLKELIYIGVQYSHWRMLNPRLPAVKGIVVKSRTGRFFYDFVTYQYLSDLNQSMTHQSETHRIHFRKTAFIEILNKTVEPWGLFCEARGESMQPTFSGQPAIAYASNAYIDNQDIKLGDVVWFLGPERYSLGASWLCKRVAALEGDRIWTIGRGRMPYIYEVQFVCFFILILQPPNRADS